MQVLVLILISCAGGPGKIVKAEAATGVSVAGQVAVCMRQAWLQCTLSLQATLSDIAC